jgi:hypothetical protein
MIKKPAFTSDRATIGRSVGSQLEEEIESWRGFPWALRREDRGLWDQMTVEGRQYYAEAVERPGRQLTTLPHFQIIFLRSLARWLRKV